jgi:hypothetical protein
MVASPAARAAEHGPTAGTSANAYRAFVSSSYWNTKVTHGAPTDPKSNSIVSWLKSHASDQYITLAGASSTGAYGMPIYWAESGDPTYNVRGSGLPPEFTHLRIPRGADPDSTGDSELLVFDLMKGWVAWLAGASFNGSDWTASGGSIDYLDSNGLDHTVSNDPSDANNRGHRGFPGAEVAARFDEVAAGKIRHVLKMSVPSTCNHVFPMAGDEGCNGGSPIPEGAHIRIKSSIDLTTLSLSPSAMILAGALQKFGAVVGDQSGGDLVVKVENTVAEGRGNLWQGLLDRNSLSAIPISDLEVVKLGWKP